jgi:hypothetical protein
MALKIKNFAPSLPMAIGIARLTDKDWQKLETLNLKQNLYPIQILLFTKVIVCLKC